MLTFGTAGLRGPMRPGPDGMNVATVTTATWAVAKVLADRCLGGSTVVVGRDARHHSAEFALATAEVFAAQGFSTVLLPDPLPTPVLAFAVRRLGAACGVQITASHNPGTDNGYKVYFDGGIQIVSPTDREIEAAIGVAPPVADIPRAEVGPADTELVEHYIARAASVATHHGGVRIALTALHGVGGGTALAALHRAGFDDVHLVSEQFNPDPDFPTVAFPNPEEPGACDALLALAEAVGADLAIALDPDADRCALGVPTADGWRMLSGDETGWLLGDHILSALGAEGARSGVVASTVVSSRLLAAIAAEHGATHVETLTGFKWLARADSGLPGRHLVYAYEEAIGHCVDPEAVRDKDGISAAVRACAMVSELKTQNRSLLDELDRLARRHGVHVTSALSLRVDDAADAMRRLRGTAPATLTGIAVDCTDLAQIRGSGRTDALVFSGAADGARVRMVVRPSGTEPKLKFYVEVALPPAEDVAAARAAADSRCDALLAHARGIGETLLAD
ncbi:phosphomannomutase [Mycobacterium sp. ACS4331]|nr:phospho-sugar mutase [Mycobacterium sp. ACS4331]OBF27885.1 phosphomannomutase [Mycobacterium sp. ACS4331]